MVIANIIFIVPHIILIIKVDYKIGFEPRRLGNFYLFVLENLVSDIIFNIACTGAFYYYTKKLSETFYTGGYIPPP
jgi:hypothetical protein